MLNSMLNITLEKETDLSSRIILIGYCDNEEGLNGIKNTLSQHIDLNSDNVYFVNIGAVVASHSGPTIVGVATL